MKKIKFLILSIVISVIVTACGGSKKNTSDSGQSTVDPDAVQTRSGVKAAVTRMYAAYFNPSDDIEIDEELNNFGLVASFLDADFEALIRKVTKEEEEKDEVIIDYDPFFNAQDCDGLELCDVKVTDYTPEKATALVTFMNLGQKDSAIVVMNYNKAKDAWLLSDFINPVFKNSLVENVKMMLEAPAESKATN